MNKSNQGKFCFFGGERKTGAPGEKPLGEEKRTSKLNPHDKDSGNRTQSTLVGGECSHLSAGK